MDFQTRTIKGCELIFSVHQDSISFGVKWDSLLNGVEFNISREEDTRKRDIEFIFQELEKLFQSARNPQNKFGGERWTSSISDFSSIGKKLAALHNKPEHCSAFWTVVSFSSCI